MLFKTREGKGMSLQTISTKKKDKNKEENMLSVIIINKWEVTVHQGDSSQNLGKYF